MNIIRTIYKFDVHNQISVSRCSAWASRRYTNITFWYCGYEVVQSKGGQSQSFPVANITPRKLTTANKLSFFIILDIAERVK